jgi:hypothetical protein
MAKLKGPPPKTPAPKPPAKKPSQGGTTTTTTDVQTAGAGEVTPQDAMTSASTTAPASTPDPAADQADDNLAAFFSTGTGPAMHYDLAQQQSTAETGAQGGP